MAFEKPVPLWKAAGTEPPEDLKASGFTAGFKPPAAFFNWFWTGVSEALAELQDSAVQGAQTVVTGTDLDTVTISGFYRLNSGHNNAPDGSDYAQLLVIHGGGDTIAQIIVGYKDSSLWVRSGNPAEVSGTGGWKAWRKLTTRDEATTQLVNKGYTVESTQSGNELDTLLETIIDEMSERSTRHVAIHDSNGYSALTGGTAFVTIHKYSNNNVVVSAFKYNSVPLRVRTKISGTWGNWVAVYTAGNKPTLADIGLPKPTASDSGKFLRVSSTGAYALETVPSAEEASF